MRTIRFLNLLVVFSALCILFTVSAMPMDLPPTHANGIPFNTVHALTPSSSRPEISPPPSISSVVPKPPPTETVAIIVQSTLYTGITAAVTQYRQDLNDSGYNTILYTQQLNTHQEVKGNLTLWNNTYSNFVGAVLIGRLPYARFHHPVSSTPIVFAAETFICDLYLMDLDGNWYDLNTDNVYDKHNASASADIYPDIFIGRIDPQCLSWDTSTNIINSYLARVHNYRTGGVQRQKRSLNYIDDDWSGTATWWDNQIALAYPTRTLIYTPGTLTTGNDWINNQLVQNYQWTHLAVHSNETHHWFGPGGFGGEGINSSAQIRAAPPSFNFYNLFACKGSAWNVTDNLGVTCAFSGSYSLAVIGSTKTGGMMDNHFFYPPWGQNSTLGECLSQWMNSVLKNSAYYGEFQHYDQWLEWYYGVNIIGDPFLAMYYDCTVLPTVISSSSHPDSAVWYSNAMPQFNWTVPTDVNGIAGYYYILDQNPSTMPTAATGTWATTNGTQPVSPLADGTWYIHVVAKDGAGNVGVNATHYQVNIDTTGPVTSITVPSNKYNSSVDSFAITWTAVDLHSGHFSSTVWVDNSGNVIYTGKATTTTATSLSEGLHIINVATTDNAGNAASDQITICVDLTNPTVSILAPFHGSSTISTTVPLTWAVSDGQSGYWYAEIRVDGSLTATVYAPTMTRSISGLSTGSHTFNVTAYDWSNRTSSDQVSIIVASTATTPTDTTDTTPPIPGFPFEGLVVGLTAAFLVTLWRRRRRRL